MKKNVFYINVLRLRKKEKVDVNQILERLNSVSKTVRDINEISKMVKKNVK